MEIKQKLIEELSIRFLDAKMKADKALDAGMGYENEYWTGRFECISECIDLIKRSSIWGEK